MLIFFLKKRYILRIIKCSILFLERICITNLFTVIVCIGTKYIMGNDACALTWYVHFYPFSQSPSRVVVRYSIHRPLQWAKWQESCQTEENVFSHCLTV